MKNIRAILFDLDGTLLNTMRFVQNAVHLTLDHFSIPRPASEDFFPLMNKAANSMCVYTRNYRPGMTDEQYWSVDHAMQQKSLHLCELYEGVDQLLKTLYMHGIPLAIVTNRTNKTSVRSLELSGIDHYFSTILSVEDVEDPWTQFKPHPRLLEIALERLGINSQNACIVGDTHSDIQAGKNAGVKTVGATYGFQGKSLVDHNPDHLIHAPLELLPLLGLQP